MLRMLRGIFCFTGRISGPDVYVPLRGKIFLEDSRIIP